MAAAAAAIFQNGGEHLHLRLLYSPCVFLCVYQITTKSGHECPFNSLKSIFKMAAAAIFQNGGGQPLLL
jgi:hypothetical protein